MDLGLRGRSALVAAGTSGLGLGTAAALAAEGARVSVCGRDPERLAAALQRLRDVAATPDDVHGAVADVTDHDALSRWVAAAERTHGGADIVVANAGGAPKGGAERFGVADYRDALERNLLSSIALAERTLPGMRDRGWGRLVFVASMSVLDPLPTLALSNVARPGVLGYAKSLVAMLGQESVTVNVVAPGRHATPRTAPPGGGQPAGRSGRPSDFGAVVTFLASEQASYIHGAVVPIDGGAHGGLW